MKLTLDIRNTENIEDMAESDRLQMQQIVEALIATGSFTGVKGGSVNIHFDHQGHFQKIEHKYFPWVRRSS